MWQFTRGKITLVNIKHFEHFSAIAGWVWLLQRPSGPVLFARMAWRVQRLGEAPHAASMEMWKRGVGRATGFTGKTMGKPWENGG